nr:hypothetical protein [uncultured Catonella sp.]
MRKYLKLNENGYSFLELLLDERMVSGEIAIPKDLVRKAGGINTVLKAKQKYELVIRIAEFGNVLLSDREESNESTLDEKFVILEDENEVNALDSLTTDCYVMVKYSKRLIEQNLFNSVMESIISEADGEGLKNEAVAIIEGFLSKNSQFHEIDECIKRKLSRKEEI